MSDLREKVINILLILIVLCFFLIMISPAVYVMYRGKCIERADFDAGVATGTYCAKWER